MWKGLFIVFCGENNTQANFTEEIIFQQLQAFPSASKFLPHYQIPWAMRTQDQNSTKIKGQEFLLFQSFLSQLIVCYEIISHLVK